MQAQNPDLVAQLRQQMGQANQDDPSTQSDRKLTTFSTHCRHGLDQAS